jgi:hypothetical protein
MKRKALLLFLIPCLCLGSVGFSLAAEADKADAKPKKAKSTKVAKEERAKLVTDGELAQWLVRVLGLSRFLSAAPTDLECFQILMQNNIQPANGWQKDHTVTMGTLARVVVQGLGRQAEVNNPEDDASWINFLKEIGIDFGTIGEAVENLEPLPQPVGPEAVITSTDPLSKLQRINPPDNQQIGADLSTLGRIFTQVTVPGRPPPMTPN